MVISIFVLSVGIIGAYTAFSVMLIFTTDSADRLTATYLSQEGIEIIRNVRDANWVNAGVPTSNWLYGLVSSNSGPDCTQGCEADYTTAPLNGLPVQQWVSPGDYLYMSSSGNSTGFYSYNATNGKPTKFKRKITITPYANGYAVKVVSQVFWDQKATILNASLSQPYVTTEEILYNWF